MLGLLRRFFECDSTPATPRTTRFQLEALDGREMPAVLNFSTAATLTPHLLTGMTEKVAFHRPPVLAASTLVPNSPVSVSAAVRYLPYSSDQNGVLTCYSPATGSHTVTGAIREKYLSLGGATGFLGYPKTDTAVTPGASGWSSTFQNGAIYWSAATGAHVVYGAILAKYQAMGGPVGLAGFPTTDETDARGGRVSRFQGADIYWGGATGAHEVHGAIREKFNASGFGLPLTDEAICPDGVGRYNHFQNGSMYWTPSTGARVVYGAIRDKWAALGWERSGLGYPTSDEQAAAGGRVSFFQNGRIDWTAPTGARVGALQLPNIPGGSAQFDDWSCGPNSASRVLRYYGINVSYEGMRNVVQYDGDLFSRVHLGTRPATLLDAIRRFQPDMKLTERSNANAGLDPILAALDRGRPVMALVNAAGKSNDIATVRVFGVEVVTGGHLPDALHWIVVKGYDRAAQTVTLMNTNGREETWSYATFLQRWNWSAGGAAGDFLTGTLGVKERTFIC